MNILSPVIVIIPFSNVVDVGFGSYPGTIMFGAVVEVPSEHGAYVLGYVNGKPAYIAVVDANGDSGVDVPWGD